MDLTLFDTHPAVSCLDLSSGNTCKLDILTLVLLTWTHPACANSVDSNQLASKKPTDLDLHCMTLSVLICTHNLDQVISLAEN